MNDGRFIFDIKEYPNFSFEKGTLGSLPTDWTKTGNGDDASTFEKSQAVTPLVIDGIGAGAFIGELTIAGTDTQVFIQPVTDPTITLNKEYIFVVYLRTAGGTGSGNIAVAGVDDGGTVFDAETTTPFTGSLNTATWTKIELKKTLVNVSTTRIRVRVVHTDAANVLYVDHTFAGKILDMRPGGSEPDKVINDYRAPRRTRSTVSVNDEAFELIPLQEPMPTVRLRIENVFNDMQIHDRFIDLFQNHLNKSEPVVFFFDKNNPASRHFLVALPANERQEFEEPRGVARLMVRLNALTLPWKGFF